MEQSLTLDSLLPEIEYCFKCESIFLKNISSQLKLSRMGKS